MSGLSLLSGYDSDSDTGEPDNNQDVNVVQMSNETTTAQSLKLDIHTVQSNNLSSLKSGQQSLPSAMNLLEKETNVKRKQPESSTLVNDAAKNRRISSKGFVPKQIKSGPNIVTEDNKHRSDK
mmetsp:Transcript_11710/g.11344  ORF Transcript_11710/g.11344 Transcript_11710/m.11344 type:complete len:123 (+) Transcript_11710:162-530(+)|eukprot:CAMPEP_0119042210 /NCGR_PEP_ID=MMETSP1177-20130426/14449_1 /TAXON_ID=2985 /ORGANISM="Ochromonas sp, Strain CCMP1899" /LENGTH=122 /DNA_ID=CAMNT_0007008829 /DNA_START=117 /DNA_END=485 /DNA_ORIENTATION=+